jgi:hypothetical protein
MATEKELREALLVDPAVADSFRAELRMLAVAHGLTEGQFAANLCGVMVSNAISSGMPEAVPALRALFLSVVRMLDNLADVKAGVRTDASTRIEQTAERIMNIFLDAAVTEAEAVEALGLCLLARLDARNPNVRELIRHFATTLLELTNAN